MKIFPPGTILQSFYFKQRIKHLKPETFCEIGSGNGYLSGMLLTMGLRGEGYDLNISACENNSLLNKNYIEKGLYKVSNMDFLLNSSGKKYDFIFSCMVIEHLNDDTLNRYFQFCRQSITPNGTICVFVPAGMEFWGIEDVIAGHFKRYEFKDFDNLAKKFDLTINDLAGLNYPVSNWLLGLSNFIVKRNEGYKESLSMQKQTVLSGNRNVKFKTDFPWYLGIVLNKYVMYPFHLLQRINRRNKKSMVIYCEFKKPNAIVS